MNTYSFPVAFFTYIPHPFMLTKTRAVAFSTYVSPSIMRTYLRSPTILTVIFIPSMKTIINFCFINNNRFCVGVYITQRFDKLSFTQPIISFNTLLFARSFSSLTVFFSIYYYISISLNYFKFSVLMISV